MKKILKVIFVLTIVTIFSSCNKSQVYKEFKTLPNYTWERIEKGKSIEFDNINIENEEDVLVSINVFEEADSIVSLFDSACADENEIYDLFGVKFLGNKALKRF